MKTDRIFKLLNTASWILYLYSLFLVGSLLVVRYHDSESFSWFCHLNKASYFGIIIFFSGFGFTMYLARRTQASGHEVLRTVTHIFEKTFYACAAICLGVLNAVNNFGGTEFRMPLIFYCFFIFICSAGATVIRFWLILAPKK